MTKHDSEHCVDMDTPSPEELAQSEVDFQDRLKRGDFRDLILIKDGHVARVGDRVVWRNIPRGGYGYVCRVPATVVAVGRARVTIEAALERGGVKRVCVRPESLEVDKTDQALPTPRNGLLRGGRIT